jgi:hypothetical protein
LWRSIFDAEEAETIHPYHRSCAAADEKWAKQARSAPKQN